MKTGRTKAVVNWPEIITGEFTRDTEFKLPTDQLQLALQAKIKDELQIVDASDLAKALMGDSIYSNMMIFGTAWQHGLVPVSWGAIEQAIRLNGAAPERNLIAFAYGRWAVLYPEEEKAFLLSKVLDTPKSLEEKIAIRSEHLIAYQNQDYTHKFQILVDKAPIEIREHVAEGYHKLLSY